tara:strand:- start:1366 stop:1752 length:387 start_codon:yes stop_codon:yes gene_type:complete
VKARPFWPAVQQDSTGEHDMIERPLDERRMNRAISACVDMILAANPWDKVLDFPQLNGSMKLVAASGSFTFFVLADGEILRVMSAGDLTQEDDGEEEPLSPLDDTEEARVAAAESAQWTWDNDPDERY